MERAIPEPGGHGIESGEHTIHSLLLLFVINKGRRAGDEGEVTIRPIR